MSDFSKICGISWGFLRNVRKFLRNFEAQKSMNSEVFSRPENAKIMMFVGAIAFLGGRI